MKINFKTILVVFLVALLGAGIGTFSMLGYYFSNNPLPGESEQTIINQVQYPTVEKTDYITAIDKTYDSVVEITVAYKQTSYNWFMGSQSSMVTSKGSGVIISSDGYIVTNNHVVENATGNDDIEIKFTNDEKMYAKLIGKDSRTDIALLKVDLKDCKFASFADSDQLVLGQDCIAIGNPLGEGLACSNGIVSALQKEIYINNVYMFVIQTNAAVNEGNSGGGLFDINGNLIGIVNAKDGSNSYSNVSVEGMGYAIPSNTVKRIVDDLKENGYVKDRAALGITVYSSYYEERGGVLVATVIEGGSADQAGIKMNDTIIAIDNKKVDSYADLSKVLDNKKVGDVVEVEIVRNNETMSFNVTLQNSIN